MIELITKAQFAQILEGGGQNIKPKLHELVNNASHIVKNSVMDEAPYITHNLQANTMIENLSDLASRVYVDEGNAPYAIFVVKGTRPHVIMPNRASVLAFEVNGTKVFARKVNHPGTKPNNYFKRGIEKAKPKIEAEKEKILNELLQ